MSPNNEKDPRSPVFRQRLIAGGVFAVFLVTAVMVFLAGRPDPQSGESLPNAAPQATEGMAR
ncbi:hypothetical protein [Hyphomicrobium sp. CS1GBMeth3]|uniref:hypothetical protein n=1 Tax=Hyphomicrobium sp. CS1GBMeth3 TaxID=1892845 RepID=UPI000931F8BB|nr:hypothetical protein [Hyphomicrobium sp. CS1GBMeth3]